MIGDGPAHIVSNFVEKPTLEAAESYLDEGTYLWNSGMFLFRASRFLDELNKYRPDILRACQASMRSSSIDLDFVRPGREAFLGCPDESIDYAVMEKTPEAVVVPIDCGWSDVGSWSALWDVSEKDGQGNILKGDVMALDTHNSYVQTDSKLIATVVVIVESDDATMVADKARVQDVKHILNQLRLQRRSEADVHRKIFRPWG